MKTATDQIPVELIFNPNWWFHNYGISFYDVGWESDVAECRRAFQDAFLNLRLSPIRMLQQTPDEIRKDTEQLLNDG
jgi:hypothetical protein